MNQPPDIVGLKTEPAHEPAAPSPDAPPKPGFQRVADQVVARLFLWAIPYSLKPNHLTVARFVLIPVVLLLLYLDLRWWAFGTFLVAMCTDFVDGTMARLRDQITLFGTYADPIADKLLVAAVLAWVGYTELVVQIMLVLIVIELVVSAIGARILLRTRTLRPSNAFGKAKMIVQSVALIIFLVAGMLDLSALLTVSLYLLWAALALLFVSGSLQIIGLARSRPKAG
jgi:CDP-diacylglycerol--glycerol-3-phosphate 3-phosphatidyltransferase